jgi:hypothetical protein
LIKLISFTGISRSNFVVVAEEGFAPPTQAFSGLCSTPELLSLNLSPKDNSSFSKIVRCHLHSYIITLKNSNSVFS